MIYQMRYPMHRIHIIQFPLHLLGITDEALYIALLKQESVLKVNEGGVEAAAATTAVAIPMSLLQTEVQFHITHPFICMIYDRFLKLPILVARIVKPA